MGLYIKGMRMPENCDVCRFSDWSNLHQTACCKMRDYDSCFSDYSTEYRTQRSEICPLVALPEKHGRLIDADAFADRIKFLIELQGYDDLVIDRYLTVGEVLNAVIDDLKGTALNGYENTPTVIEEEDEA